MPYPFYSYTRGDGFDTPTLEYAFRLKYPSDMNPEALFHYCSSDAFVDIIMSRQLRLSTLALGNDWMEGRLSFRALIELLPRESMKLSEHVRLISILANLEQTQMVYGLGFCLSAESDLLSQWRGYARDGSGVAIGFRCAYLEDLVDANKDRIPLLNLCEIQYGDQAPLDELASRAEELMKLIKQGALDSVVANGEKDKDNTVNGSVRSEFYQLLVSIKLDAYRFKSAAFREENEYRLLATSRTEDTPASRDYLQYRAAGERILAYTTLTIPETANSPISEIMLGPKHATPCEVVEEFLELNGFKNVSVRKSSASYR